MNSKKFTKFSLYKYILLVFVHSDGTWFQESMCQKQFSERLYPTACKRFFERIAFIWAFNEVNVTQLTSTFRRKSLSSFYSLWIAKHEKRFLF